MPSPHSELPGSEEVLTHVIGEITIWLALNIPLLSIWLAIPLHSLVAKWQTTAAHAPSAACVSFETHMNTREN